MLNRLQCPFYLSISTFIPFPECSPGASHSRLRITFRWQEKIVPLEVVPTNASGAAVRSAAAPLLSSCPLSESCVRGHEWVGSVRRSHCFGHDTNEAWGCGRWRLAFLVCAFLESAFSFLVFSEPVPPPSAPLRFVPFLWPYHSAFPTVSCPRNIS